ncbi:ATP-dependent DNA helicase pfh1 [Phytophthora citrophthora]|uniref:ATP-dependent DNA helicase n=1 Tax=Phytophthora citrophthora TaxID=4793 RepID=A0AAD9GB75_9STRA|nr:ATP-dependent DNA helicase pfh1 [Phytophthora citrophthora]
MGCMFPTLFPGGCGGPDEPRLKPMSVRKWVLRCLQVHGRQFETHHAFMLLAFDYLASEDARRTLYVKMNVKRQALKAAEIPRSTVQAAIKYFNHMTVCRSRGIKPRPPSLDVQQVIDVRKGLHVPETAFYGSNAGRMRARHDLFGLMKRFGPLQIFFTVSPDSAGSYSIGIKSRRVSQTMIQEANVELLPTRAERKSIAGRHPVECARYFLRVMKTVVEVLLGWDPKLNAPKRGGGIFGVVRAFGAATETQLAGDLHVHIAVWLYGFPTTAEAYGEALNRDSAFKLRIVDLADSVLSTKPPCIINERRCPKCLAMDSLQAVIPGIDAFRRPAAGASPPLTAECKVCHQGFRDKDIMELSLKAVADEHHVRVDASAADFQKCRPAEATDSDPLASSLLVRDLQTHYWNHCKSCFKSTLRTPKASVCRFFKPTEVNCGSTTIDGNTQLRLHRAIGCEYVNPYNPVVMTTLKCNHDAQFVLSGGAKQTAAYVIKYCCKRQNPVENYAALSLAAFAKASKKTSVLPPETSALERGYRILGSMLYSVTNGQEVAATMAALYILHETPFWFSHDFVHVNLKNLLRNQLDSVEVTVSQERRGGGQPGASRIVPDSALERLENVSFMDICERYEYSGKIATVRLETSSGSSREACAFSKALYRKVMVLCGEEIPDITSNLDPARLNYYYTAIVTLFKPHRRLDPCGSEQNPLAVYRDFVQNGAIRDVQALQQFEEQWRDYYHTQRSDKIDDESPESVLLRTRAPATASSVPTERYPDTVRPGAEGDEPMAEPLPDDFLDIASIMSPEASTTKLVDAAAVTVNKIPNLGVVMSSASKQYLSVNPTLVPPDFDFESYTSRINKQSTSDNRYGTQTFIETFPRAATRLQRLEDCYGPVPFPTHPMRPRWSPESLLQFPTIAMVSEAFMLNFWQHVMFEVAARHLLYAYSLDIESTIGDPLFLPGSRPTPFEIRPQLISYLGGQAGTGKSTVVDALLSFARLWGRVGSVETLAFTGAAAINIHGKTLHTARNLKLSGAEPNSPPSNEMKTRFSEVVLVIIDEISITDQALLGGTDSVSRMMSMSPEKFMGGKHVLLIGDYLQLPPVAGNLCFQTPPCSASRLRHAGFHLYSAINFVVFLMRNMRARTDPLYAEILDSLRWGRLSDEQLAHLNTRVQSNNSSQPMAAPSRDAFYRPFVVSTNKLRSAINNKMIFQIAAKRNVPVYECLASSSSRSQSVVDHLYNVTDDLTDRVPMKLLFYIGMPIMATRKHPLLLDADVIANGVTGTIVGMHPTATDLAIARYTVDGVLVHRLLQPPQLLLIKIFGCQNTIISGFGEGVIGLPPLHTRVQLTNIPNLAQASITVDQFAVVPAFSCTTEKLQGQTCHDRIVVTTLKRQCGTPKQTLYVALSRAVRLSGLTLTEQITREYLDSFKPSDVTVQEIQRLIQLVAIPPYASATDRIEFGQWKTQQHP